MYLLYLDGVFMSDHKLVIGDKKVFLSGSFIVPSEEATAALAFGDLSFYFVFSLDKSKETKLILKGEGKTLRIEANCHEKNFRNGITKNFLNIGEYNKEKLGLSLTIEGITSGAKIVHYTLVSMGELAVENDNEQ